MTSWVHLVSAAGLNSSGAIPPVPGRSMSRTWPLRLNLAVSWSVVFTAVSMSEKPPLKFLKPAAESLAASSLKVQVISDFVVTHSPTVRSTPPSSRTVMGSVRGYWRKVKTSGRPTVKEVPAVMAGRLVASQVPATLATAHFVSWVSPSTVPSGLVATSLLTSTLIPGSSAA